MSSLPQPWIRTPVIESAALSQAAGCRIFLKLENLQPSGSFKSRGLGNLILDNVRSASPSSPPAHFYTSSGGNAGLGAVGAARVLNRSCTVVVPETASAAVIARLRAAGAADVIQTGASWREADAFLRENLLTKDPHGVYVPPFEHELVYAGNGGIVRELAEDLPAGSALEPDAIVCSVGGGGLFCGISLAVDELYAGRPTVVAVETKGAESLSEALERGELVTLERITSLATSLGATRVGAETLARARRPNSRNLVVADAEAAMGCWRFADDHRTLVELACGATVCLAYSGKLRDVVPNFSPESKVVLVVCGGVNVSVDLINEFRGKFGEEAEQLATGSRDVPSTHTAPR